MDASSNNKALVTPSWNLLAVEQFRNKVCKFCNRGSDYKPPIAIQPKTETGTGTTGTGTTGTETPTTTNQSF